MSNDSKLRGPWGIAALVLSVAALAGLLWLSLRRPSTATTTRALPGEVPASVREIGSNPAVAKRRAVEQSCRAGCAGQLRGCEMMAAEAETGGPSCADQRRACEAGCRASVGM